MPGYVKGLTLYSALTLSGQEQPNNTHGKGQVIQMKNDFFLPAYYRLIRLLLTTDPLKNLSAINLHFAFLRSCSVLCRINPVLTAICIWSWCYPPGQHTVAYYCNQCVLTLCSWFIHSPAPVWLKSFLCEVSLSFCLSQ